MPVGIDGGSIEINGIEPVGCMVDPHSIVDGTCKTLLTSDLYGIDYQLRYIYEHNGVRGMKSANFIQSSMAVKRTMTLVSNVSNGDIVRFVYIGIINSNGQILAEKWL